MKIKRLLVIFGIFMIMALLFNVNNAYATSKKETTVNTAEEYKTAMADDTYDVVYLGADITLTNDDTPSLYEININEVSHRVLDLNGHELTQRDYVRAKVSFIGDNKKFEVKNSNAYDKGRMVMHSNFCTVYNESQWSTQNEIIFTRIQYENENTGSYVLYKGNDEAKEVTFRVDCVTFYYPNNSPLNDDLKLKITSLTVFTKNQTGPVGFYNDENQKHISDVIEDWQDIYIEEQRWNDDRDTTWARDVYLSNGQYDKKLEIIEHKTYDVWANGKRFFEGGLTKACGEGTATFDPETATLTLNNATIENVYEWKPYYLACIYSTIPSINIKLVGANVISPIDDNSDAIDVPAGCSVNIFGGGTLTISGGYYGTYLGEGGGTESNLTIDGVTISILNSGAAGLWVNNNIDIKNSKVNILKEVGTYSGIVSNDYGTITVKNSIVNIETRSQAIHFGNPYTENPAHRLHIISGTVKLTSTADGADVIHVQPEGYYDFETWEFVQTEEEKLDISVDDGYLELNVPKGGDNTPGMGTNALQDQIHLLSNVVYTSGTSLRDKASKEEGIKIVVESKLFPDVPVGKWYSNSIRYCANLGLITGYTKGSNAGKFGLNDTIKRGQIATILYRLEGSPEVVGESPFPDVQDSSKYYYDAAIWASQNEIVTGYTKGANAGKFGPNDDIKRQDLAVMLGRYAKYKGINITTEYSLDNFRDKNDVSGYAKNAPDTFIQYMIENGVITGKEKNIKDKNNVVTDHYFLIDPKATATRSQAATMVERFCHIILNMQ